MRATWSRLVLASLALLCVLSVVAGQFGRPDHFTNVGKDPDSITAFLKASIALGDSYLIKNTFHTSLLIQYPVVFDSYLKEEQWLQTLQRLHTRSPDSPPVLWALSELYRRSGDEAMAREYADQARSIDPRYNTVDSPR